MGQNRLNESGFARRLYALTDTLLALFATFGDLLKHLHTEARYVLDSFPVAVCHNTRIPRCKLLTGKAYHGRCASKRSWFYGLKVQVVATSDGIPVEFYIYAGAESEQVGPRRRSLELPTGSMLYTDAGYTDYAAADVFNEASGSQQVTARKKNSKRPTIRHKPLCCNTFAKVLRLASVSLPTAFPSRFTPSRPPDLR